MAAIQSPDVAAFPQYYWMAIVGTLFSFFMAFGIGANDVANSFATSVAAKSVTLRQAVCIASVFEFSGALFLGASVTNTIRSNILDSAYYENDPEVLMFGMLCALVTGSIVLIVATYLSYPVSTTHTIVGGVVGFSLAAKGFKSVQWFQTGMIFVSWVASPLLTGALAAFLFLMVKKFVLHSENPYPRAIKTYPLVLFVALTVSSFFVIYKAANNNSAIKNLSLSVILPVSFGIGIGSALIFQFAISPFLQRKIARERPTTDVEAQEVNKSNQTSEEIGVEEKAAEAAAIADGTADDVSPHTSTHVAEKTKKGNPHIKGQNDADADTEEAHTDEQGASMMKRAYKSFADATFDQDLEGKTMKKSVHTAKIWEEAEQFNPDAEKMFSYLQVFTACMLSFGHGANDVANAVAPLSAIIVIYDTGSVPSKSGVPQWVLALGGAGIVIGLLLYGYKMMSALGYRLAKLSPSRGFCIELSASLIVVIASFAGIPVSSTQCQVGGTIGVGATFGRKQVDWKFVLRVAFGWVASFITVVLMSAGIFAFSYYSPAAAGFA